MSNLYMTTEEFADMVIQALHDQNYFKKGGKHHPGDIVIAFTSAAESIASALEWAITQEGKVRKEQEQKQKLAMMQLTTLKKSTEHTYPVNNSQVTFSPNTILPQDDEIAPALLDQGESVIDDEWVLGYSEWKKSGKSKKNR